MAKRWTGGALLAGWWMTLASAQAQYIPAGGQAASVPEPLPFVGTGLQQCSGCAGPGCGMNPGYGPAGPGMTAPPMCPPGGGMNPGWGPAGPVMTAPPMSPKGGGG